MILRRRDYFKAEVQKLEDYMGEGAMDTNENIGGVEDHEEVYSFTILSVESIYRFGRTLDTYKNDSVEALAKLQASREKQKPGDLLEYWVMVR